MNDIQPIFRLVVKLKDHLNLPYHDTAEINHIFLKIIGCPLNNYSKIFPDY